MNVGVQEVQSIPALPDLFVVTSGGVHLMSSKCNTCGTYFFPKYNLQHRPGCSREGVEDILLTTEGTLASYTVQHYKTPLPFKIDRDITPYALGMVEFPEGIQVAGIIVDCCHDQLKIGIPMKTTTFLLYHNDEGKQVLTWAFRPAG